jgi:hypothetical protein
MTPSSARTVGRSLESPVELSYYGAAPIGDLGDVGEVDFTVRHRRKNLQFLLLLSREFLHREWRGARAAEHARALSYPSMVAGVTHPSLHSTSSKGPRFPQPCVVLRIFNRPNPRYHCPFLYDDAHHTIGCHSPLEENIPARHSSLVTYHSPPVTRHRISNLLWRD